MHWRGDRDEIIAFNIAHRSGSEGWMGPLAVHPDLTYEHRWKTGQLLVWDNRCVLHRATAYDAATQGRVIRRCTVLGEVPA